MTDPDPIRARHSLRLLLDSDREFGLEEVALRMSENASVDPGDPAPPPTGVAAEPSNRTDTIERSPSAPTSNQHRDTPTTTTSRTDPSPSAPPPKAAPASVVFRDRLPDVRTSVPRLSAHAGDPKRRSRMDALEEEIFQCQACGLCQGRKTPVAGEGSVNADLMFVGEGPGGDEDRSGRPFVGAAGVLLSKIIQAMGFTRESVFIANAVKCRPPQNRTPVDTELDSCRPFLERQIEIIQPKVICALGRPAAQALLKTTRGINALRGKVHQLNGPGFNDIVVVPTFHPAYLLRRPEDKGKTWSDVQLAAKQVLERGGSIPNSGALPGGSS